MQNFNLLRELGRHPSGTAQARIAATIEELLLSAEYILGAATTM